LFTGGQIGDRSQPLAKSRPNPSARKTVINLTTTTTILKSAPSHCILPTYNSLCSKSQILLSECNLFRIKPTRCTLLLSIIISTSVHFSGNYVHIIRRIYRIYATLVVFVLYGWLSGLLQQSRQPPIQSEKYQFRLDKVSSPDDRHIVARNM